MSFESDGFGFVPLFTDFLKMGGSSPAAELSRARPAGVLYVSDSGNNRIQKSESSECLTAVLIDVQRC